MQPGFRPTLKARPSLLDLIRQRSDSFTRDSTPGHGGRSGDGSDNGFSSETAGDYFSAVGELDSGVHATEAAESFHPTTGATHSAPQQEVEAEEAAAATSPRAAPHRQRVHPVTDSLPPNRANNQVSLSSNLPGPLDVVVEEASQLPPPDSPPTPEPSSPLPLPLPPPQLLSPPSQSYKSAEPEQTPSPTTSHSAKMPPVGRSNVPCCFDSLEATPPTDQANPVYRKATSPTMIPCILVS